MFWVFFLICVLLNVGLSVMGAGIALLMVLIMLALRFWFSKSIPWWQFLMIFPLTPLIGFLAGIIGFALGPGF